MTYSGMQNLAMQEKLNRGECIDVSHCPRTDAGHYELTELEFENLEGYTGRDKWLGVGFCDAREETWIRSIGRHRETGRIYGSTDAHYYQNPAFECLHLR